MSFLNSLQGVFAIIIMICTGIFIAWRGWVNEENSKLLSKLVTNIALPAYMISNLLSTYDRQKLAKMSHGLPIPFGSMIILYILSLMLSRILKIPENRKGIFCSMFAMSNTIFVGLPVNMALFGEQSLPYVLVSYIANTTLFWTLATHAIRKDGKKTQAQFDLSDTINNAEHIQLQLNQQNKNEGCKHDNKQNKANNAINILTPPLMGFIVAIIFIFAGIYPPRFVMDTCKYLGALTTPLSMLFIGSTIYNVKIKDFEFDKGFFAVFFGRFILSPVLVAVLSNLFPIPVLMKKVLIVQAAMPVMTQTAIVAKSYGSDHEYAAVVTTATTIASMVMIPVYMLILGV